MAQGALAAEVVGWFIFRVTGLAVGGTRSLMIESCLIPGCSAVTQGALPAEVVGWFIFRVAVGAVGRICHLVIESGCLPSCGCVASTTFTVVMVNRLLFQMAGFTLAGCACILSVFVALGAV